MKKNIVIVHYNTPHLTECLVRSINLFVSDAVIYIFDNSDKQPFTAKFDNVTILDNTKGEIINFEKWLEKYPNRNTSHGRVNNWGSAKHCYSVEKCMEILKEDFILLDSDVLLKKDISPLFDNEYIFTAEVGTQPHSTINRVLPFICYINVGLCLDKGIHYFDDNYMHGLYKSNVSDKYDTGAGFFFHSCKLPYNKIKSSDYILHYGHGSWNKLGYKPKVNQEQWLELNKRFWSNERNRKVIYTCITGGYDSLLEPDVISKGFDYICFTDNPNLTSEIWEIRPLPKETESLSQVKKQRYVKIKPHLLLSEYDISVWVDGNVSIKSDINEFVNNSLEDDISIYIPKHPSRNCIFKEAKAVVSMKKDKNEIVQPQIDRYKEEGMPDNYGLLQSNIMLRKHNNEDCVRLMTAWFDELKDNSHRDQLSFNYVLWKNMDIKVKYLDKFIYKSKYFFWNGGHKKTNNANTPTKKNNRGQLLQELKANFYNNVNNRRKITTDKLSIYYV